MLEVTYLKLNCQWLNRDRSLKEKRRNQDKYLWSPDEFAELWKELDEGCRDWIKRAQSLCPNQDIFKAISKGEIARLLAHMISALSIDIQNPEVFMKQLIANVFAKGPDPMTMLATVYEIAETFLGKDLKISDVMRELERQQQSWRYHFDFLKAWRNGNIKAKADEAAAAVKEAIDEAEKRLISNLMEDHPDLAAKIQQGDFTWDDLPDYEKKTVHYFDELGFADWSEDDRDMFDEMQRVKEKAKRDAEWARRKRREKALKENEALKRVRLGISFIAAEERRRSEWTWKTDDDDD